MTGHLSGTTGDGATCFGDSRNGPSYGSLLAGPNWGCDEGVEIWWERAGPNIRPDATTPATEGVISRLIKCHYILIPVAGHPRVLLGCVQAERVKVAVIRGSRG